MPLPVFCSPKKLIFFFFLNFNSKQRKGWRFRLGIFATVCSALYRGDFNTLIQAAPKSWKMLPPQGEYESRKATMSHPVYRDTFIRLFLKAAQMHLPLPMNPTILRMQLCERWDEGQWSLKVAPASKFVYKCKFLAIFFFYFSLNLKQEINIVNKYMIGYRKSALSFVVHY